MIESAKPCFHKVLNIILFILTFLFISFSNNLLAQTEVISIIRQDCEGYTNCYNSLAEWQANFGGIDFGSHEQGDLVSTNQIAIARIEGTWTLPDTDPVNIDSWITDANHYIYIYTTPEARHTGTSGTGYRLAYDEGALAIRTAYARLEGLEIYSGNGHIIYLRPETDYGIGEIHISHNLVHGNGISSGNGIYNYTCRGQVKIWNNIVYDVAAEGYNAGIQSDRGTVFLYNNTVISTINGYGIRVNDTAYAKNNLCEAVNDDFIGAFFPGSNFNASSDNTAPGLNSIEDQSFLFIDRNNNNYHLASGNNGASNYGIDLSNDPYIEFSDDIDDEIRAGGWDIGADEQPSVPDNNPPSLFDGAPAGNLPPGTSIATLTLFTNENATCRYSTLPDIAYETMTTVFSNTGSLYHSHEVSDLQEEQTYTYYIKCRDETSNANNDDFIISFYIESSDEVPPVISNIDPINISPYSATITWQTNENTTSQVEYGSDLYYGIFSTINDSLSASHVVNLIGLEPETTYHFRVRSKDIAHNESISDDYTFTTPAHTGNIYYVNQGHLEANDLNPGNQYRPWLTIQHAADIMEPGDMVIVYPGDYERIQVTRSGTPSAYITFKGATIPDQGLVDPNAIFDPANPEAVPGNPESNAVTKGFTLAMPWDSEERIEYIRIENFEITHIAEGSRSGIYLRGTDNIQIVGNFIHDINAPGDYNYIGINGVTHQNSNILVKDNTLYRVQGTGIDICGENWIVEGNELSHGLDANTDDGRHVGGDSDAFRFFGSNHIIRNNYAHDYLDIEQYGDPHIDCFQVFSVYPESQFAHDILVECNTCRNMGQMLMSEDQSEEEGGENAVHHITFRNNIFQGSRAGSIILGGYVDYFAFVNNVVADAYYTPLSVSEYCHHVNVLNNIFYNNGGGTQLSNETSWEGSVWDYNIFYPDFTYPPKQPLFDQHSLFDIDPEFMNSDAGNFLLTAESPAIDIGIARNEFNYDKDYNSRPAGLGWDLGAYEFLSGSGIIDTTNIDDMTLFQNFPNPFYQYTIIAFYLTEPSKIDLALYDMQGRRVRTIFKGDRDEGLHYIELDDSTLNSGIYFIRLIKNRNVEVRKCLSIN